MSESLEPASVPGPHRGVQCVQTLSKPRRARQRINLGKWPVCDTINLSPDSFWGIFLPRLHLLTALALNPLRMGREIPTNRPPVSSEVPQVWITPMVMSGSPLSWVFPFLKTWFFTDAGFYFSVRNVSPTSCLSWQETGSIGRALVHPSADVRSSTPELLLIF